MTNLLADYKSKENPECYDNVLFVTRNTTTSEKMKFTANVATAEHMVNEKIMTVICDTGNAL